MTDEKRAEKLFQEWLDSKNLKRIGYRYYDVVNWDGAKPEERFYNELKLKEAFIAGFNADKWHYPSKGEYPPSGEEVFVAWTSEGSYDVVEFRHCMWGVKLSPPYAWQYIEPPKEEIE